MQFKLADLFIIIFSASIISLYAINTISSGNNSSYVLVKAEEKEYIYPLDQNIKKTFIGPIGETTIVIKDGEVYVEESDCKNKTCIKMGHIHRENEALACLPNKLLITIEGEEDSEIDILSY